MSERPFVFGQDTFAYTNELVWEYRLDPTSVKIVHTKREPPPSYTHCCFAMARSAQQFFIRARFDARVPMAGEVNYRRLIQQVVHANPRKELPPEKKIVIPGYATLFAFSQAQEELLKQECGSAWQSYFQRGHWRMVFPLSRAHQERLARQLADSVARNRPAVIHVVRFPKLSINHAMVLHAARASTGGIIFTAYDPNRADKPVEIVFDRQLRRFFMEATHYFGGGRVDVYEIYHAWNY